MKKIIESLLSLLLLVFSASCSSDEILDGDNDVQYKDSLVLEIELNLPTGAVIYSSEIRVVDTLMVDSVIIYTYCREINKKTFRYVFYDDDVDRLVDTECVIYAELSGTMGEAIYSSIRYAYSFAVIGDYPKKVKLERINKVTLNIKSIRGEKYYFQSM